MFLVQFDALYSHTSNILYKNYSWLLCNQILSEISWKRKRDRPQILEVYEKFARAQSRIWRRNMETSISRERNALGESTDERRQSKGACVINVERAYGIRDARIPDLRRQPVYGRRKMRRR